MTREAHPFPHWSYSTDCVEVRFVGRTPEPTGSEPADILSALGAAPDRVGWLRQEHSAIAVTAADGLCGKGDGLWTAEQGLALCIVTADCVPVVCAARNRLAAIHAGWRGLASGVIAATVGTLPVRAEELEAWLGPSIGPCCYEVGHEVAARVAASSSDAITSLGRSGRPHLDLHMAAAHQLRRLGVTRIHRVTECTHCHSDLLWSYRGSGGTRGRNLALAWLNDPEPGTAA